MKYKIMRVFHSLVLYLLPTIMCAQTDTTLRLQIQDSIVGHYSSFSVDNLGNVYALTMSGNQIKKISPKGDSLAIYNDVKQYGNIYAVDVSNPLKMLLYYRDFTTIVVLDRFLNKINKIDLRQAGIMQAKAMCQSYDNHVWVFDQQDYKLKKVDDNGTVLFNSDDFRVLFDNAPNPSTIVDNNGSLYLYDEQQGWVVMDYYGSIKKEYQSPSWKDVGVQSNVLYGWSENKLHLLNPDIYALKDYWLPLDLSQAKTIRLLDKTIFVLGKENIGIYSYKLQ